MRSHEGRVHGDGEWELTVTSGQFSGEIIEGMVCGDGEWELTVTSGQFSGEIIEGDGLWGWGVGTDSNIRRVLR